MKEMAVRKRRTWDGSQPGVPFHKNLSHTSIYLVLIKLLGQWGKVGAYISFLRLKFGMVVLTLHPIW